VGLPERGEEDLGEIDGLGQKGVDEILELLKDKNIMLK